MKQIDEIREWANRCNSLGVDLSWPKKISKLCDALEVANELFSIVLLKRFDGYVFTSHQAHDKILSEDLAEWCNKNQQDKRITILRASLESAVEIADTKIQKILEAEK